MSVLTSMRTLDLGYSIIAREEAIKVSGTLKNAIEETIGLTEVKIY